MANCLDLHDASGFAIRVPVTGVIFAWGAGQPVASTTGYSKGCFYVDTVNGFVYRNEGTNTVSSWIALADA